MSGIAVHLVARTTTSDFERQIFALGHMPDPTSEQVHLYTLYDTGGLILVSLGGLVRLQVLIRKNRAAAA